MLCTTEFWSASPARFTVRTVPGKPPILTNSAAAEGTVLTSVTSPAAASVGNSKALAARITFPPTPSGTKISKTERSKQTEVEASTPDNCSESKTS
jgi:hypothetical protein